MKVAGHLPLRRYLRANLGGVLPLAVASRLEIARGCGERDSTYDAGRSRDSILRLRGRARCRLRLRRALIAVGCVMNKVEDCWGRNLRLGAGCLAVRLLDLAGVNEI